jgi:hypothetical protein
MVSLDEAKLEIADLQTRIATTKMDRSELREVEMSITRLSSALQRMTGSREVDQALNKLNRLIFTIRMVQVSFTTLEATTPIGWIFAIASWLGLAVTVGETVLEFST